MLVDVTKDGVDGLEIGNAVGMVVVILVMDGGDGEIERRRR